MATFTGFHFLPIRNQTFYIQKGVGCRSAGGPASSFGRLDMSSAPQDTGPVENQTRAACEGVLSFFLSMQSSISNEWRQHASLWAHPCKDCRYANITISTCVRCAEAYSQVLLHLFHLSRQILVRLSHIRPGPKHCAEAQMLMHKRLFSQQGSHPGLVSLSSPHGL